MHVEPDAEVRPLRAALRDLVALSAIPTAWIGTEPSAVAAGLADALVDLLQLDFAFVRLSDPGGAGAVEVTRGSAWTNFPEWLEGHLATSTPFPRKEVVPDVGDDSADRRGFAVPVGFNGEGGVVAAASERSDFPTPTDKLLLSLAANHAAVAFQSARLIHERKQAENELRKARNELEVKVAERTAKLHVANDELSSLRRVATLVAQGGRPAELFSAVGDEVGQLLGTDAAAVVRFDHDGPAIVFVGVGQSFKGIPVGTRWELDDSMATAAVYRTGRSARVDAVDWPSVGGPVAEAARRVGVTSTIACPILVDGRLWGAVTVSSREEPLPLGAEARLAKFTDLVATAIANSQARDDLHQLAEEQAALRRVATLVARPTPAGELFAAVTKEVGHLLPVSSAAMGRYDPDGMFTTIAAWTSAGTAAFPVGGRWVPEGRNVTALAFETGRPARIDDFVNASGAVGLAARDAGYRSAVGTPIVVEGRLWGVMTAASTAEQPLPADTEAHLARFTELVAMAIANAESREELTASRARIVASADESRRRLERNLHDGAQQRVVSLALQLRAVEAAMPFGDVIRAELARTTSGLDGVLEDLQEISRGLHPAVLSEGGLRAALKALARRSAVPVKLDVRIDDRLPERIEVAAYYVASEALTNAAKHARASVVNLRLARSKTMLTLSIRDDGIGGADATGGSGLVGLTDRVEALGGKINVTSPRGEGTSIHMQLPVD